MKVISWIGGILILLSGILFGISAIHNDGIEVGKLQQRALQEKAIAKIKAEYEAEKAAMRTQDNRQFEQAQTKLAALSAKYVDLKQKMAKNDEKHPDKIARYLACKLDTDDLVMLQRTGIRGQGAGMGTDRRQTDDNTAYQSDETANRHLTRTTRPVSGERAPLLHQPLRRHRADNCHSQTAEVYSTA